MPVFRRVVHTAAQVEWGPADKYLPDMKMRMDAGDGSGPFEPQVLVLVDDQGSTDVYVFDDGGKQVLLQKLTGVIIPQDSGVKLQ